MQKMKFKIPIHNLKFPTLILLFPFFLISFLLFTLFSSLTSILYAQQCLQSDLNEGLISAVGTILGNTGNINQICVTGTEEASYREFKVPSYQNLEDQFYTLTRSTYRKGIDQLPANNWSFTGASSGNGIYLQTGDVSLNSVDTGTGVQVIFIRGKLDIIGDINYADADSSSGLVFVVQGDINIYSNVKKINAVLISTGIICSSYTGITCANVSPASQLVVNGSLISLNKTDLGNSSAIRLVRNLELNDRAAEVVNKQPKYLYILRNGMFTKDLIITTEDSHYDIPGITNPPPSPPPTLPPAVCTPVVVPQNVPYTIPIPFEIPGCIEFTDS